MYRLSKQSQHPVDHQGGTYTEHLEEVLIHVQQTLKPNLNRQS